MISIQVTATLDCSLEHAWQTLADYRKDPQWRGQVSIMTCEPAGLVTTTTTTHEVMRFAGRTLHNDGEVTVVEIEPNRRRFEWRTVHGPSAAGSRSVQACGDDRCIATLTLTVRPQGLECLIAPLARLLLRRDLTHDLRRLRHLLRTDPQPETEDPVLRARR